MTTNRASLTEIIRHASTAEVPPQTIRNGRREWQFSGCLYEEFDVRSVVAITRPPHHRTKSPAPQHETPTRRAATIDTVLNRQRIAKSDKITGQKTSVDAGEYLSGRAFVELITDGQGYSATHE